jgi:hypothetical protein
MIDIVDRNDTLPGTVLIDGGQDYANSRSEARATASTTACEPDCRPQTVEAPV